jgi:hypothetical protein
LKFVLEAERAERVEAWAATTWGAASRRLATTTLLCLDTADLAIARRSGDLRRERFRVRRDGASDAVVLERKSKRGDRTRLRASEVALRDLPRLATAAADDAWPGRRFHRHVVEHGLRPACRVTFERVAYAGAGADGPVRLTFDRRVRGAVEEGWSPRPVAEGEDVLEGRVLVEARFPEFLPAALRGLVATLRLEPASFSKYRRVLAATGRLAGDRP